eukprot:GEMP01004962.1.p1 GENE.GEMP01004962.1~~GEMP01004962.1.p1  ORF type:complete len:293 (+),score=106.39 GEMP01004962.1:102-881(+)
MGAACSSEENMEPIGTVDVAGDQALTQEHDAKEHQDETEHEHDHDAEHEHEQKQAEETVPQLEDKVEENDGDDERQPLEDEDAARREAEERRLMEEEQTRLADEQAEKDAQKMRQAAAQLLAEKEHLAEAQRLKAQAEEARKTQQEQERRDAEEKAAADKFNADKKKMESFLKQEGFTSINEPKKVKFGQTVLPLHHALKKKDAEMVKIMLKNNADPNKKSKSGRTALEKATKYQSTDNTYNPVLQALKDAKKQNNLGA